MVGPADTAARHDPRPIAFAGTCSKTKIIGDGRARRMLCDGPRALELASGPWSEHP